MSFIISIYTNEGMVMAADSRLMLNTTMRQNNIDKYTCFGCSNTAQKIFATQSNVGIATCGDTDIMQKPIAGYVEAFIERNGSDSVERTAQKLLDYFRGMNPDLNTTFHVAGYTPDCQQKVFRVHVATNTCEQVNNPDDQGATWNGETDVLTRILKAAWTSDEKGNPAEKLPCYSIPWEYFSLQDAIDFAIFATLATSGAIRFQNRIKSVGGPIDILVLKPNHSVWIQRKQLHGESRHLI